jgi:hypothetical protein
MAIKKESIGKTGILAVLLPALIIIFPFGYSLVAYMLPQGTEPSQPFIDLPDEKYENCVRDTEYMRFHHWELLRQIREEFVRYGKRGDLGLFKCKECHTSRERFCNQCHNAVSLTPDCYGCHYYP